MTPFIMFFWLLVAHALCDYPLQGEALSKAKRRGGMLAIPWYHALTAHAMIHAGAVALITGRVWLGLAEGVVHWAIDYSKCAGWIDIDLDQTVHVGCKALWVLIATGAFA